MYKATGDQQYLYDAEVYYVMHQNVSPATPSQHAGTRQHACFAFAKHLVISIGLPTFATSWTVLCDPKA